MAAAGFSYHANNLPASRLSYRSTGGISRIFRQKAGPQPDLERSLEESWPLGVILDHDDFAVVVMKVDIVHEAGDQHESTTLFEFE